MCPMRFLLVFFSGLVALYLAYITWGETRAATAALAAGPVQAAEQETENEAAGDNEPRAAGHDSAGAPTGEQRADAPGASGRAVGGSCGGSLPGGSLRVKLYGAGGTLVDMLTGRYLYDVYRSSRGNTPGPSAAGASAAGSSAAGGSERAAAPSPRLRAPLGRLRGPAEAPAAACYEGDSSRQQQPEYVLVGSSSGRAKAA